MSDPNSDDDDSFEVGRRHGSCSSSRDSSPVAKRQKRTLTPPSEQGDLVVTLAHNDNTETPTPEDAPLIRQAMGFSSINANVTTYQATRPQQPVVPYFLPGQAPPPPPPPSKPKPSKPRAPRKKRGEQYLDKTSKFKLIDSDPQPSRPVYRTIAPASTGNSATPSPANTLTQYHNLARSMIPAPNYSFVYTDGNGAEDLTHVTVPSKRGRKKKQVPPQIDNSSSRPSTRSSSGLSTSTDTSITPPQHSTGPMQRRATPPPAKSPDAGTTQGPSPAALKPTRMVTLLIEDLRSGVVDAQLAEVRIPVRAADDPEDGFWADAVDICNALQGGPSRIDGAAKVYTMRGRFRQIFMRVDQYDQAEVQSAHIGVSKERTLNIYVEVASPVPQGQLPRRPAASSDAPSGSERETMPSPTLTYCRPNYSLVTREDQMERLSKSRYARPDRRASSASDNGSYARSQGGGSPNARHGPPRRGVSYAGSIQRLLTPPIPARIADTQEERDEAITNYVRTLIENHPQWVEYMESKAKPQRVSEVMKQYNFVDDQVRELMGRQTPSHWDGAPTALIEKYHIWQALKLKIEWSNQCEESLTLISYYGKDGSRYEDSRVVDMMNDTSPPKANAMEKFLRLLRFVDDCFTHDAITGQLAPTQS